MYIQTTATKKIKKRSKRILAIPGGTSASKTISVLLYLIALCQTDKVPTITSVTAESFPHLRRGAIRDFLSIMKTQGYYNEGRWDKGTSTYTFETGSQLEFFSAGKGEALRGGRRDRLFMNEANNMPMNSFDELEVRTKEFVILDWNPTNEFWYYTEIQGKRDDVEELTLTYKDNEALDQRIVDSIEQRRNRPGWFKVYGLGQLGEVEGRIYTGWKIIDEIPHEARLISRGLDFGYTNDPTALVDIYYYNGGYVIDEIIFTKGLSNKQISEIILAQPKQCAVIADSAEPKSIDEMRLYGITIMPATKGKGSVMQGIQFVQDQRISATKSSVNVIKEFRNYLWDVDKDGKVLNVPEKGFGHSMDAIRYGMQIKYSLTPEKPYQQPAYQSPSISEPAVAEEVDPTAMMPEGFVPHRRESK